MSPTEPTVRQHASTGPASPQLPEPAHAERVRTPMSLVPVATLSTLSRKHPGFPFGSLMPFALDSAGRPIFLISNMAMHTQNLKADPRCSLFVTQASADGDPLGALVELEHPTLGQVREIASPLRLSGPSASPSRGPFRGEHTDSVLREVCGYSDERIGELRAAAAFGSDARAAADTP